MNIFSVGDGNEYELTRESKDETVCLLVDFM